MWKAKLNNGETTSETTHKWGDIKNNIKELSYIYNGLTIDFPQAEKYIQYKTASACLFGGEAEVESQTIGFAVKNENILFRFDFKKNKISVIME